jgi:L,D-transpeptidase ErfK/SrfK
MPYRDPPAPGHNLPMSSFVRLAALPLALVFAAGCQLIHRKPEPEPEPVSLPPVIQAPVATHEFVIEPNDEVVGELQVTKAVGEDTLPDIARRFNLGYEEISRANPGVDVWLPGEGREIVLPTQFVLPAAPREGVVINLAQLRVFYFPKAKEGEPQKVITHPIGVG